MGAGVEPSGLWSCGIPPRHGSHRFPLLASLSWLPLRPCSNDPDVCSYDSLKAGVDAFNAANRWRKQGIAVMPIKYCMSWQGYNAQAIIRVYPQDGHVEVRVVFCCRQ